MTRKRDGRLTTRVPPPYDVGNRVVIDLPARRRRVNGEFQGARGTVTECWTHDLGIVTGDPWDDWHFTVDVDDGGTFSARYVDLRRT